MPQSSPRKILMIATDERYLPTNTGKRFPPATIRSRRFCRCLTCARPASISIAAFPDAVDGSTPAIGYMPGGLTWLFGKDLPHQGVDIINSVVTGATHQDRKAIIGVAPLP